MGCCGQRRQQSGRNQNRSFGGERRRGGKKGQDSKKSRKVNPMLEKRRGERHHFVKRQELRMSEEEGTTMYSECAQRNYLEEKSERTEWEGGKQGGNKSGSRVGSRSWSSMRKKKLTYGGKGTKRLHRERGGSL